MATLRQWNKLWNELYAAEADFRFMENHPGPRYDRDDMIKADERVLAAREAIRDAAREEAK